MAQFICPGCGSTYFQNVHRGGKNIFTVSGERAVEFVQQEGDGNIELDNISCCACSWKGGLGELVHSDRD